jgi:hypothetical protein
MDHPADPRRAALLAAEEKGMALFDAIEQAGLIAPGRTEKAVDEAIFELAKDRFGVTRHWHKRIVRAGPNSVCTFHDNPPPHTIEDDDTVYLDLGPVFEASDGAWEADLGRTYALGKDPEKNRLVADLPRIFQHVQAHFHSDTAMTGAALFAFVQQAEADAGWLFGGFIAGHIIGEFAHTQIPGDKDLSRIWPRNRAPMNGPDALGRERYWILEIHLIDRTRSFGGFYERLL